MTMRVETGRAAARWACFSSLVLMLAFSASSAVFYPSQGTDAVTNVSILEYSALETHRTGRRLLDATEYAQQTAAAAWRGIEESEALEGTPIPGYLCEGCGFALPTQKRYHLKTLTDALTKLGFDEVAADVPGQWTLYWSFRFPSTLFADLAKDAGRSLRPGQAINHFASMGGLTTKSELWKSFRAARDGVGRDLYDFVPEHVYSAAELQSALAREATQLERVVRSGDAPPRPSWAQGDDEFGRRWVYKKRTHRGVKFVDTAGLAAALDTEGGWDEKTMAARYIEPLLIGGHKFDVGVYVAITSVSPLRVYIHRNVLLRFCKLPYPSTEQLRKGDPPVDSYVVDEYLPPWEIDGLSEFFNVIPTSRVQGTYQIDALRQYLDHRRATGTDPADAQLLSGDEFWARTKRSVVLALLARLPKLKDGARLRDSDDTKKPFFELLRWDFVVDTGARPWLAEVNMSPNLHPKYFDSGNDEAMKRSITEDVLRLALPRPTSRHLAIAGNSEILRALQECLGEWRRRGDYTLVWPPEEHEELELLIERTLPDSEKWVTADRRAWRALSAAVRDAPVDECGGCSHRGVCRTPKALRGGVAGAAPYCACPPGFVGAQCQISEPRGQYELPPRAHNPNFVSESFLQRLVPALAGRDNGVDTNQGSVEQIGIGVAWAGVVLVLGLNVAVLVTILCIALRRNGPLSQLGRQGPPARAGRVGQCCRCCCQWCIVPSGPGTHDE